MNQQKLYQYIESKAGSFCYYPFGPDVRVYKVGDESKSKMFALIAENESPLRINLKCEPDEAMALRDIFESVIPGYHMNKQHWNTVILQGDVPEGELERMIDNSYQLIVASLPKKTQKTLAVKFE